MKRIFLPKRTPKPSAPINDDLVAHALIAHPRPHDHLAVLPTQEGLFLRPYRTQPDDLGRYIRISWGKSPKFEEFRGSAQDVGSWASAIIVYGIVGILELFTGRFVSLF